MSTDRLARAMRKARAAAVANGYNPATPEPQFTVTIGTGDYYWGSIASFSVTRGRASTTSAPTAATMSALMHPATYNADLGKLRVGRTVFVRHELARTLLAAAPEVGVAPSSVSLFRFVGQLTDAGPIQLRPRPERPGWPFGPEFAPDVIPIAGSSLYARLARVPIGRPPWPPGTPDKTIIANTLATAWNNDPGLRSIAFPSFEYLYPRVQARPSSGREFIQWDVDNQTPDSIFADLVASTFGQIVERRNGEFDWITPESRRAADVALTLGPEHITAPTAATQNTGSIVNSETVTYGPSNAQATVTIEDEASIFGGSTVQTPSLGRWPDSTTTKLARADQAAEVGMDVVARQAYPEWRLDEVSVDLIGLIESGQYAVAARLNLVEIGDLIELTAVPAYSPAPAGLYWVEGISESYTPTSAVFTLKIAAYRLLAPPIRLADTDAALRLVDLPADLNLIRATVWKLEQQPTGTLVSQPSNYRISDAPATQRLIDL